MHPSILKYPRTPHLQGSRLQPGDSDLQQVPYSVLAGRYIVVEEKLDGGNSGLSYTEEIEQLLQCRGHYLTGGPRERQFTQFKAWAATHRDAFFDVLYDRYIMYGEWMAAKHTVFYDALPHLFLEFDVFDRQREVFLSTAARRELLAPVPVLSVPVLYAGIAPARLADLLCYIRPSLAKTPRWRQTLRETAEKVGLDVEETVAQTENSDLAEGLYIKVEEDGETVERYKWVRADFVQHILDGDSHWDERPLLPNQLVPGVDLFAPHLTADWPAGLTV